MTLYAASSPRRELQMLGDLALLVWVVVWIWLSQVVHDKTMGLAAPGRKIDGAATSMADRLRDAGSTVGDIPLVGDDASRPFDGAGGSADQLAEAGRSQVAAVESLAFWLALSVALIPIVIAVAVHVPPRVRFYRRAVAGRRFLDSAADLDLFALRALANQPLHVLARVSPDPAGAWLARDRTVTDRLAALELKAVGLPMPASGSRPPPPPPPVPRTGA